MNYQQFINQQITDYQGKSGYVVSFNEDRIVINQNDEHITFNPDIAFKNKALIFVNQEYNNLVNKDMDERIQAATLHQQKIDKINKEAIKRNKMASDKYIVLERKEKALKRLFGDDFIYPPFTIFKRKFPHSKRKKSNIELMLEEMKGSIAKTYPKKKDKNVQSQGHFLSK